MYWRTNVGIYTFFLKSERPGRCQIANLLDSYVASMKHIRTDRPLWGTSVKDAMRLMHRKHLNSYASAKHPYVHNLTRDGGLNNVSIVCCVRSGYTPYGSQTAPWLYQGIKRCNCFAKRLCQYKWPITTHRPECFHFLSITLVGRGMHTSAPRKIRGRKYHSLAG